MKINKVIINPIIELAEKGKLVGILLILSTIFSLLFSNSDYGVSYLNLWNTEVGFSILHKSILHWINDGLMVIFFLLVGLEIKRELIKGELSTRRQAILPIIAAIGGMIAPAVIFFLFHLKDPRTLHGWAIPTATDIAFSLGILTLLGKRVPFSMKVFLTALAIIDDLGAIVIIAAFYAGELHLLMVLCAAGVLGILILFNILKVRWLGFYLIPGIFLWYFVLKSGIHPTIAGVLLAFTIPTTLAEEFEHQLQKPVNYLILPLFALANTAMSVSFDQFHNLFSSLSLGIVAGLMIGKPVGIATACWIVVKTKASVLPQGANWNQIVGVGLTAGIGFTMSIFISTLSFKDENFITIAKLAILIGSTLSAVIGMIVLHLTSPVKAK